MNYEAICLVLEYQYVLEIKKKYPDISDDEIYKIYFPRDWLSWNEYEKKADVLARAIRDGENLELLMQEAIGKKI